VSRLKGDLEEHSLAYLTTSGRLTGEPHRIEIWFAIHEGFLWVNSGGGRRSDWVKNLIEDRRLVLDVGDERWSATATLCDDVGVHPARQRLAARYQGWRAGQQLSEWARTSLLIRVEADDAS